MKQHYGVVTSAKILNVISAGLMLLTGLLLLILPDLAAVTAQRILLGILFGLTGVAKVFGYFSNDLYRIAFQFDFAVGIFCEIMAALAALVPANRFAVIPLLITVYITLDGLMKLQMSLDARRFGMKSWVLLLVTALLLVCTGGFAVTVGLAELMRYIPIVGIALMLDGLENAWVTAFTVRIRARKKNIVEQYGIDMEP